MSTSAQEALTAQDKQQAAGRLAKMALFAGQPPEVLLAVAERMVMRFVPGSEMVFVDGAPGDSLYLIDSGQVEITASARAGSDVLARLGPDDFFGEMALLTGKPRTTAARAVTNASLWALTRSSFEELAGRFPSISLALSKVLSERLAEMDRRYSESQLRRMKLLSALSSSQLEEVSHRLRPVRFRRGQVILREGDPGEDLVLIESGRVQLVQGSGRGAFALGELGAGDMVGESALLTGSPQAETATALSDVSGWALGKADFDELVSAYPSLALAIGRDLSERLRSAEERRLSAAPAPAPVEAAPRPAPRREPVRREPTALPRQVAQPVRREPRPSPLAPVRQALASAARWFGSLTVGAKVRLVLIVLLLAWLIGIAVPSLLIRTLAASHVTDLTGAIAFVQRSVPSAQAAKAEAARDGPPLAAGTDTRVQEAQIEVLAMEPAAATEVAPAPTEAPPSPVPATATPWIIVVTNTPAPATDTPVPTVAPTPAPTATPKAMPAAPAPRPVAPAPRAQPARDLDPRLGLLNVGIAEPGGMNPGQSYFRLVRVRWENEAEAASDHTIYIEVLDENGSRLDGQGVQVDWPGGSQIVYTENKPPTDWPANFPMYAVLGSYTVYIAGQPSDRILGLGMGTPDAPTLKIHTNFKLVFQRTTW